MLACASCTSCSSAGALAITANTYIHKTLRYSTDIKFLHQSTGCLPLPGCAWLTCQKNKPNSPMAHVTCKSKLRSVLKSSMHPCPESWVAIGRVVVYYARVARAFSAGIKCRHCTVPLFICSRTQFIAS